MSILVKGMEMPKNCKECALYIDGACYAKGYRDYRSIMDTAKPDDCPLVEIPTPHGRLIDADKLKSRLVLDNESSELQRISTDILKWIDIQETVIEGSET